MKGCVIHMYKIAVIGEKDSIIGFSALGFDIFSVDDTNAQAVFLSVSGNNEYAIIYLTETYYELLQQDIEKFKDRVTPAVILIPGGSGSLGFGSAALDAAVERAIGTNIL